MANNILLNGDLKKLLDAIPDGTTIRLNVPEGYDGSEHFPRTIRKVHDDLYEVTGKHEAYPLKRIYADIANKRISLGTIISLAEKNEDFNIDINDEGKFTYNVTLEEAGKKQNELTKDSLILFRETMPKQLVDMGMADSPTKITEFVYDKICARFNRETRKYEGKYPHQNVHGYDPETLEEIKEALDEPLAIIRTKTKNGDAALAVLTAVPDSHDKLSLVIMQQDKDKGENYITSIYGKQNNELFNYLKYREEEGNLLYLSDDTDEILKHIGDKHKDEFMEIAKKHRNPEKEPEEKMTFNKIDQILEESRVNKRR